MTEIPTDKGTSEARTGYSGPVKIAEGVYWVGAPKNFNEINANPYLIIDNGEGVLIDPGSVLDFDTVYRSVTSLISLDDIRYIVLQHQDPDLCSSMPLFEKAGFTGTVATHWRTSVLVHYYGITSPYHYVNSGDRTITFGDKRTLTFLDTPYLHFPGAVVTFDQKTGVLFSSDIFGAFIDPWELFADDDYITSMLSFHENYMPGNEILAPVMAMFERYPVSIIAPQHGSIITKNIGEHISALKNLESGLYLGSVRKALDQNNSYTPLVNAAINRLLSLFPGNEVEECVKASSINPDGTKLFIDESIKTGREASDHFFETVLSRKGPHWVTVIEPMLFRLASELDLAIPAVYQSPLVHELQERTALNDENARLLQQHAELRKELRIAEKKLATDPLTELFQESYFLQNLLSDVESFRITGIPVSFMIIEIDDIISINKKFGSREGDETINHATYLLRKFKKSDPARAHHLLFKLTGPRFAYCLTDTERDDVINLAEDIRIMFQRSDIFIEQVTVTIGVVHTDDFPDIEGSDDHITETLIETARERTRMGRTRGKNCVIAESDQGVAIERLARILLVDSDVSGTAYLSEILDEKGFDVLLAADGQSALEMAGRYLPRVIVSEVMLPKLDGFSLRNALLKESDLKDIPFIFLSYLKDDESVARAHAMNIHHYYTKPYQLVELTGIIRLLAHRAEGDQA